VRHLVDRPLPEAPEAEAQPRPRRRRSEDPQPARFGFLIHYTEEEDIRRSDPSFRDFSQAEMGAWSDWVKRLGPGYARRIPDIVSATGARSEGWIMSVPMLPEDMRGRGRKLAAGMIRDAVDMAADEGIGRVGLGAFTSVVTRGGEMVTGAAPRSRAATR
jgi:predicted amino acid dehydrogenase